MDNFEKLREMIDAHKMWLDSDGERGTRFGFHGRLDGANLEGVDLRFADLSCSSLNEATLTKANLSGANLYCASLIGADLSGAIITDAKLYSANFRWADLSNVDFTDAKFSNAILAGTNLTNTKGLISTEEYLDTTFEKTEDGYIVYKIFGMYYEPNPEWIIKSGSIIEEPQCNMDRRRRCTQGINVATKLWVTMKRLAVDHRTKPIWKCLIRYDWMDDVCVPYATDGNIRCKKLQLIEMLYKWG